MIPQVSRWNIQHVVRRPRLQSLIHEGLRYPLLVILAAPGYGKTQAMAEYAEECKSPVLWLHLGAIDNLPSRFWVRLMRALGRQYPALSDRLQGLSFPDSLYSFDSFAQVMEDGICGQEKVIWVFDDYGIIDNQQIKEFIRLLVEANFENFHLVLLSNVIDNTESIAFMTNKRVLIIADDLRFNKNEIREFYRMHGIRLENNELDALERYTEGWPLPLSLLASQNESLPRLLAEGERMSSRVISHLFEEKFFSAYPLNQQKMVIQLSMMDSFTKPFAIALYEGPAVELELLGNHAFVINEPATDRFYLHHLYRTFLQQKRYMLSPEDERKLWGKAAEYYWASGDVIDAITCYSKCKDYGNMLEAIMYAIKKQVATNDKMAAFYLEYIDQLTPAELQRFPIADYIRALIYTVTYQLDKAELLVVSLEERISKEADPDSLALLGEVYITHGLIRMMRAQTDFGFYYEKACACLPNGSRTAKPGDIKVYDHYSFFMPDNAPGAREHVVAAVHAGVPWMIQVMKGSMSGMPSLFSSEASYLTFHMEEAKQHAYRAIHEAKIRAQYDVICNGYGMLAKIGLMQGDYPAVADNINQIIEYAKKVEIDGINEIRDTATAWYYVKMRDFNRLPKNVIILDNTDRATISYGRLYIAYANYLIGIKEFSKLIGILQSLKELEPYQYITQESICLYIMLAIGYRSLGNDMAAMDALWAAYDMCYQNGLIALFVEADAYMVDLIAVARKQTTYAFAPQWLDLIDREAAAFSKRSAAVRAAYMKKNPTQAVKDNPLSKRELCVLQLVAQGLTREEIALEQYISMNTVKSTITSIYNKLNASNKADAVSIAITKGYIEGHTPERKSELT